MPELLDSLAPGHWLALPGSRLGEAGIFPVPPPPGLTGYGAVMSAWSGAAYDPTRHRLLVWGGGHQDYAGNELYAFSLETFSWARMWGPTPNDQSTPTLSFWGETYLDGTPRARHTYSGLLYLPALDVLWCYGGLVASPSGGASKAVWTWQGQWTRHPDAPQAALPLAAYDHGTGLVYVHTYNALYRVEPLRGTWTRLGQYGPGAAPAASAVVDERYRYLYLLGTLGTVPKVGRWDLASEAAGVPLTASCGLTWSRTQGDTDVLSTGTRRPAALYDPVRQCVVAWNGGTDMYHLDSPTRTWTRVPAAAENTVSPGLPTPAGVYGRFAYVPEWDVYLLVTAIDQPVYLYRPTA